MYKPSRKSVDQTTYAIYYKQQEALKDLEVQLDNLGKKYASTKLFNLIYIIILFTLEKKNGTNSEFFQVEAKEITPKLKKVTKPHKFI